MTNEMNVRATLERVTTQPVKMNKDGEITGGGVELTLVMERPVSPGPRPLAPWTLESRLSEWDLPAEPGAADADRVAAMLRNHRAGLVADGPDYDGHIREDAANEVAEPDEGRARKQAEEAHRDLLDETDTHIDLAERWSRALTAHAAAAEGLAEQQRRYAMLLGYGGLLQGAEVDVLIKPDEAATRQMLPGFGPFDLLAAGEDG